MHDQNNTSINRHGGDITSRAGENQPSRALTGPAPVEKVVNHCFFCGTPTYGVHCKVNCPNCGYREDCSDLFRA